MTDARTPETRGRRIVELAAAGLTLLLDLLLVDAAIETWASGSPARTWPVVLVVLYAGLTVWLISRGAPFGRRPGWLMLPEAAFSVLLLSLIASSGSRGAMSSGVRLLHQPTAVVLAGATLVAVLLAAFSLARPRGARWWWRLAVAAVAAYSVASFALGLARGTAYFALMGGGAAFWERLPYWLQGPFVGGLILVPMALVWEIGLALARLVARGRLGLMVVLALGLWLAYLGVTVTK
jgi:hypothetical protein